MYTLISHGSRIQVAQFFDAWGREKGDNPPEEKIMKDEKKEVPKTFDYQAAQACTRKNAEAEKIDMATLGNPNITLMSDLERGFTMTEKLPAIVSTPLPLMGANADTTASNRSEALPEKTHMIKSGDTLSKIAQVNGTTVAELQRINQLTDINKIRVGETLHIPPSTMTPAAVASAPAAFVPAMPAAKINTTPNTQNTTVASKPTQKPATPETAAKTPQQELDDAKLQRGTAIGALVLPTTVNKEFYENMKKQADANIARLTTIIDKQEAADKYNNLSPNGKIHADYTKRFQELQVKSVNAGRSFSQSPEFKQAFQDVATAKSIVDEDIKIARLNGEYAKIPNKTSVAGANEARIKLEEITKLTKSNNDTITKLAANGPKQKTA